MVTGTALPFGLITLLIPNGGGMTPSADRDLRLRADHYHVRYRPVCGTGH